jgi:hypothetical protein
LNFRFIASATASGRTSSSGTVATVKIAVARMPFQNGSANGESPPISPV